MKNYTTPRTLADCNFTTGYPIQRFERAKSALGWLTLLATAAAIGVLLAYRG